MIILFYYIIKKQKNLRHLKPNNQINNKNNEK